MITVIETSQDGSERVYDWKARSYDPHVQGVTEACHTFELLTSLFVTRARVPEGVNQWGMALAPGTEWPTQAQPAARPMSQAEQDYNDWLGMQYQTGDDIESEPEPALHWDEC